VQDNQKLVHRKKVYTFVDPDTGEVVEEHVITGIDALPPKSEAFRKFKPSKDYYAFTKPMMLVYFYCMNHLPTGKGEIRLTPAALMQETGMGSRSQFYEGVNGLVGAGFLEVVRKEVWKVNRKYAVNGK
jgi:hypothetical protein